MAQKNMKNAIKMSIEWKQEEKQQIFHLYLCACENIKILYVCQCVSEITTTNSVLRIFFSKIRKKNSKTKIIFYKKIKEQKKR